MKLQGAALSCSGSRLLAGRVWLALCAQGVGRCPLEGRGQVAGSVFCTAPGRQSHARGSDAGAARALRTKRSANAFT